MHRVAAGRLAAWAALAILVLVPSALAAEATFTLRSELPVTVEGRHAATADGAFLIEGDAGAVVLLVEARHAVLERVVHRASGYHSPDEPHAGITMERTVEVVQVPLQDGYLRLVERRADFTLLVHDGAVTLASGAHGGPLHLGALSEDRLVQGSADLPLQLTLGREETRPFSHLLAAGHYQARALDGRTVANGPFTLYLGDAVVDVQGADGLERLRAHFRVEERPGALYDPVRAEWFGVGTHTSYVHEYHVLRVLEGRLQVQHAGTPGTVYSAAPTMHVEGTATFPGTVGEVRVLEDDREVVHTLRGEDLAITGRFTFALDGLGRSFSNTGVTGGGDLTEVSYAATTHTYDWARIAAAAGLGALLFAAVAWLVSWGKGALPWVGGAAGVAAYARVQGEEIMEHPGRLEVYERVKGAPGIHFMDLCDRVTFGASTLNYHLRVLERNGYVTRVRDGRFARFFDARSGEYTRDRKHAASTLRNATTAAIASYIVQHPGVVQRDLAHHFGIAPSTVSWHVDRLRQNGLVEKQRDQHFTRYYMGPGWSTLPAAELARVGLVA